MHYLFLSLLKITEFNTGIFHISLSIISEVVTIFHNMDTMRNLCLLSLAWQVLGWRPWKTGLRQGLFRVQYWQAKCGSAEVQFLGAHSFRGDIARWNACIVWLVDLMKIEWCLMFKILWRSLWRLLSRKACFSLLDHSGNLSNLVQHVNQREITVGWCPRHRFLATLFRGQHVEDFCHGRT